LKQYPRKLAANLRCFLIEVRLDRGAENFVKMPPINVGNSAAMLF
jgi:hypothetical protein